MSKDSKEIQDGGSAAGDCSPFTSSLCLGWSGCERGAFLPRALTEVLVHPGSTLGSREAVNADQSEMEQNLPSVLAMRWCGRGTAGEEVGSGAARGREAGLAWAPRAAGGRPPAAAARKVSKRCSFLAMLEKSS